MKSLSDSVGQDLVSPTIVDDRMPEIDTQPLISCEPNPNADRNDLATASLPGYKECHSPTFVWGCHDGDAFCQLIEDTYKEVIHWRRNLFKAPTGKNGNDFVGELARLIYAFQQDNPLERIALKAAMVLPVLLLQKPITKSRCRDHSKSLGERLAKWHAGAIDALLLEGRTIQGRLTSQHNGERDAGKIAKAFDSWFQQVTSKLPQGP